MYKTSRLQTANFVSEKGKGDNNDDDDAVVLEIEGEKCFRTVARRDAYGGPSGLRLYFVDIELKGCALGVGSRGCPIPLILRQGSL